MTGFLVHGLTLSIQVWPKISGLALHQSYDVGMGLGPSNLRVVSGGVWIPTVNNPSKTG